MADRILSEANVDYVLRHYAPKDVTQLEYVECNGSQYIDLGYHPNNNTEINTMFKFERRDIQYAIFSSRNPSNTLSTFELLNDDYSRVEFNGYLYNRGYVAYNGNMVVSFTTEKISSNISKTGINGTTSNLLNETPFTSEKTLWLFASSNNGIPENYAYIKMYHFTICENGKLLKYFIPAICENKIGMYDIVTGIFVSSGSSSELIAGPSVGKFIFPKEYLFTDYIDNGKTGYIDTDFIPIYTTKIVSRMKMNSWDKSYDETTETSLFGARNKYQYNGGLELSYIYDSSENKDYWLFQCDYTYDNSENIFQNYVTQFQDIYIEYDGNKKNPTLLFSAYDTKTFTSRPYLGFGTSITIFGLNSKTGSNMFMNINQGDFRFYHMHIFGNGQLQRNFWPAVRKSDNQAGILDIANNVFYTDSHFTYDQNRTVDLNQNSNFLDVAIQNGSASEPATIDYVLKSFKRNPVNDRRPFSVSNLQYLLNNQPIQTRYEKLEYLENNGSQYIDLGFYPTNLTSYTLDAQIVRINSSSDNHLMSCNASTFFALRVSADHASFQARWGSDGLKAVPHTGAITDRHVFRCDKGVFQCDSNAQVSFTQKSFKQPITLALFCFTNASGVRSSWSYSRVYSLKIYENGSLILDMIPCHDTQTNSYGMYDAVSKKLFTNNGTGSFTTGPVIGYIPE